MRDLAIQAAGGFAIFVSVIHGILGETKVFARARIEPAWIRLLLRLIFQCSTVAWIGFGVLLVAAPYMASEQARLWIVGAAVAAYGAGAIGNAWATRGRHFGWMAMAAVSVLAVVGA
ncbi:MAG: hypothetical protein A3D94_08340 [Alphaproteobacteria bacterium RIFCSPHIGHO2_12_FULL_66_14]|jgi:hypothetical protein|nr:MAG: hypothetical protein A3D94_08340 [Alphaproteobacteria bacterium RIFCSPHIGHO2_12_FULL_66_14]